MDMKSSNAMRRSAVLTQLTLLACAVPSGAAWAQANPWSLGVGQSVTHESNVFQTSRSEGITSDTSYGTTVFGGFDQPFGRQRVYLDASIGYNKYQRLSRLDNVSSTVSAGFDWSTVERLSGTLRFSRNEGQGDYSRPEAAFVTTGKNTQITEQYSASADYALTARTSLTGGLEHRTVDVSNTAFGSSNLKGNVVRFGVAYSASSALRLGTNLRYTEEKRPTSSVVETGGTTTRRNIDVTANWIPSGLTTVNARISLGDQKSPRVGKYSSAKVSGQIGATYKPTAKIGLTASVSRDTGSETTFQNLAPLPGVGSNGVFIDNNRQTTATRLGVSYAATSKIGFDAGYSRSDGKFRSAGGGSSDNITETYSLGAQYAFSQNLSFNCGYVRETRPKSSGTAQSFSANTVNCAAQYALW